MMHTGTVGIDTERLLLRRFGLSDAADMLRNWTADPLVQNAYGEPAYDRPDDVRELLQDWLVRYDDASFYRWAVILKGTGENIGQIAFCRVYSDLAAAEIEYCIGRAFWGPGYAAEALDAVIRYAFKNAYFVKIEAFHVAQNARSGRVLQKSKMKRAPSVIRFEREGVTPENEICYALTRDEYFRYK